VTLVEHTGNYLRVLGDTESHQTITESSWWVIVANFGREGVLEYRLHVYENSALNFVLGSDNHYEYILLINIAFTLVLCEMSLYGTLSFMLYPGGHDDAKVSIPTTIILRHMFTPAELRVIISNPKY